MVKTSEARSSALCDVARAAARLLADIDTPPWSSRAAAHVLRACGAIGTEAIAALPREQRRRAEGAYALLRDVHPLPRPPTSEESFAVMAWDVGLSLVVASEASVVDRAVAARLVLALWATCPPTVQHCRALYAAMTTYRTTRPHGLRLRLSCISRMELDTTRSSRCHPARRPRKSSSRGA